MLSRTPPLAVLDQTGVQPPTSNARPDSALVFSVILIWICIAPLMVPSRDLDRGIFVSVGERLLAGDTLYSGVYDNKDPLFYYLVAAERAAGAWAELAVEIALVAIISASAFGIAKLLASRWVAAAIGFVAVPLIVTGEFYVAGATHLPGIALVMAACAMAAADRPGWSGVFLASLFFLKLIFLPVAVVAAGCLLLARARASKIATVLVSAAATLTGIAVILGLRGELWPYVETMAANVFYAQGTLVGEAKGPALLLAHLERVNAGRGLAYALTVVAFAITIALIPVAGSGRRNPMHRGLVAASILACLASVAVLAVTGMWWHHNQIMYIPATLAMVGLAPVLDLAAARTRLTTLATIALGAYLLGGAVGARHIAQAFVRFPDAYGALSRLSPEAELLLAIGPSGSYARLGSNDDLGHAIGLRAWRLVCPHFHQYAFQSAAELDRVLACASQSPVLLIGRGMTPATNPERVTAWNEFLSRMDRRLEESYDCTAAAGLRICTRRPEAF